MSAHAMLDDSIIVTVDNDRTMRLWETRSCRELSSYFLVNAAGEPAMPFLVAPSPDGSTIVVSIAGGGLAVYERTAP